ncbi:MAG: spore photoproduct lyase family protein [Armatimonadota bacterium]
MYDLTPGAIYALDDALRDERCAERIERMVRAIRRTRSDILVLSAADIPRVARERRWAEARRKQGEHARHTEPDLIFTRWLPDGGPDASSVLERCPAGTPASLVSGALGEGGPQQHHERAESDRICRSRWQFDTIYGCPHGCAYCSGGRVATIFANVEEYIEQAVAPTVEATPWQKVFMFNSCLTDILAFEPEYELVTRLASYFDGTPDRWQLVHTKSANVEFLVQQPLPRTICLWSMTSATVSREIEPGSATTGERIEAARRCREAGYPVRVKFKPIVPVRGWQDEAREMIRGVVSEARPETIGLCFIAWMPAEEMERIIEPEMLDPRFVEGMRGAAEDLRDFRPGPFPHELRAEVYDFYLSEIRGHDAEVPVFLCTESREMWREFAPKLGFGPRDYPCGCGPQSPPGTGRVETPMVPEGCDLPV